MGDRQQLLAMTYHGWFLGSSLVRVAGMVVMMVESSFQGSTLKAACLCVGWSQERAPRPWLFAKALY